MQLPLGELLLGELQSVKWVDLPLYRRIFLFIRQAVLEQTLPANARLPSSRNLASELGISRNTMLNAYEQLLAEGFLYTRPGSGTYVTGRATIDNLSLLNHEEHQQNFSLLSRRGTDLTSKPASEYYEIDGLVANADDFSAFPLKRWQQLQNKHWRLLDHRYLDYDRKGGYPPLRQALTDYLRVSRSVHLQQEQIFITAGTQQSLDLCARLLTDSGDTVWLENPSYWGAQLIFQANQLNIRPINVDQDGMKPNAVDLSTRPRMIYVTPSHQYPLDTVMGYARRKLLCDFALQHSSWILEDDYDSEFRYRGSPLVAMQGMAESQVIYLGTFAKVLYPGIKIGYVVVPERLIDAFRIGLSDIYRPGQVAIQAALADFIRQGHFSTHIRSLRSLYGQCRSILQQYLRQRLPPNIHISNAETGLHFVIHLPDDCDDQSLAASAAAHSLRVRALSHYYLAAPVKKGLVVGYGYSTPTQLVSAAAKLTELILAYVQLK